MADRAYLERFTKELVDKGMIIEAGWISLRLACDLVDAPADQLREMRMAFLAGSQHLMGSIMTFLEAGEEPTDNDMKRIDLIHEELQAFIRDFELRHTRNGAVKCRGS